MKILVFLLVLANLLLYAFSNDYLGKPERPDAERMARQVLPERVRIVSRGEEPPLTTANERPEEIAPPVAASEPETAAVSSAARVCLLWEQLPAAEADRLGSLLGTRFPVFTVKRVDGGENGGWWIYIPPLANKAEADKKAGELRQLGVTDYFVVQEGPNRFAVSLGIFSSEKGGQDRLAELKNKGVRSARLMPRPGKDGTISLQAEGPAADRATLLSAVNGGLAKPLVRDCP
ncbi:SPOR domain-containing protein [Azonexus sp.]|uniref:SPOR domain-containing protein n=1 Tax=Azonexus sp. TaxID=1872668 RepID=UPI0028282F18|nr:SPOR domain-containing protein [Azonexus sp.]MDR1995291.1 SPOR domain-containing protein [Azonexus sp.]